MATGTRLITVVECMGLASPAGGWYELHHGELVLVTRPKQDHSRIRRRLRRLLESALGDQAVAEIEVTFRPAPEYEVWTADVAVVSTAAWETGEDYIPGVPLIVIEVLSPSNTESEMLDRERICLENGGREFWVVGRNRQTIQVSTPDGRTTTYGEGWPLSAAASSSPAFSEGVRTVRFPAPFLQRGMSHPEVDLDSGRSLRWPPEAD